MCTLAVCLWSVIYMHKHTLSPHNLPILIFCPQERTLSLGGRQQATQRHLPDNRGLQFYRVLQTCVPKEPHKTQHMEQLCVFMGVSAYLSVSFIHFFIFLLSLSNFNYFFQHREQIDIHLLICLSVCLCLCVYQCLYKDHIPHHLPVLSL